MQRFAPILRAVRPLAFGQATRMSSALRMAPALTRSLPRGFATTPDADQNAPLGTIPGLDIQEKTPEEMIAEVPPIEIDGAFAVCDGGKGALGHPVEYIRLDLVKPGTPATCKYCGLRYVQKLQ